MSKTDASPAPNAAPSGAKASMDTGSQDVTGTIPPSSVSASALTGPTGAIVFPAMMGRYRLERELGRGAMGNVYLAHDTDLDRPVALKIPKFTAADNQELIARFLREARAAAVLAHPNICRVYDVNEHQGVRYIAMEFIEGKPLSAFIAGGNVQAKQAASVIRKLALGLAEAHQRNILHRDLKPDNILVNKQGEPVLTDFGLARETTAGKASATQDGVILGSPAYMPPEQAAGNLSEMGPTSDIYSLGVVLYEMLTGEVPFRGSVVEVLASVLMKTPKTVREQKPDVDPGIAAICDKMMAKKAGDRYPTMMAVAQALGDWLRTGGQQQAATSSKLPEPLSNSGEFKIADPKSKLAAGPHIVEPKKIPGVNDKPKQTIAPGQSKQTISPTATKTPERTEKQINELAELGDQLLVRNDYLEAIRLAEEIPDYQRTPALRRMLGESYELKGKVEKLERNLEKYLNTLDLPELKKTVTALLKIHPGHPRGKEIKKALNTGGKKAVVQILKDEGNYDAVGNVWEPKVLAGGIAGILALAVIAYFAVTIYIKGTMQEVAITIDDPTASVTIDGKDVLISGAGTGEIKLTLGSHEYTVTQGGTTVRNAQNFTVNKNGQNKLVITLKEQPTKPADSFAGTKPKNTPKPVEITKDFAKIIDGHTGAVLAVCVSPDSKVVYAASADSTARAWDAATGSELWKFTAPAAIGVIACSPDGKLVAVGYDKEIFLLDAKTGEQIKVLKGAGGTQGVTFTPDSRQVIDASINWTSGVWDVASGEQIKKFEGFGSGFVVPQVTPDGTQLYIGAGSGIHRWKLPSGEPLPDLKGHEGPVIGLEISSDGQYVISASSDKTVGYWNAKTGEQLALMKGHTDRVMAAGFLPGGKHAVSGGLDKKMILWNLETKQQEQEWPAHETSLGLRGLAVAPNGGYIASGGYDSKLRLWKSPVAAASTPAGAAPPLAVAPFDANQAKAHQEAWAKHLGVPVEFTNSIGMKFRLIPPGEFTMGSMPEETQALEKLDPNFKSSKEQPGHKARITKPFYLGMTEVTAKQWQDVMGSQPWLNKQFPPEGDDGAVNHVSWIDAGAFCGKLQTLEQGRKYRLATEAEWEMACRAGTTTLYYFGNSPGDVQKYAWNGENSEQKGENYPHRVGQKPANPYGLFDMPGNLWEWCFDFYDEAYYKSSPSDDPTGPAQGETRAMRGGAWVSAPVSCRSAHRDAFDGSIGTHVFGFRVALPIETVKAVTAAQGPPAAVAPFDAAQAKAHQDAWAKHLGVPVEYTNSLGMKFRLIPPGEYLRGSSAEKIAAEKQLVPNSSIRWQDSLSAEGPPHKVVLTKPIYLGIHEVTQQQFEQILNRNPAYFTATGGGRDSVVGINTQNFPVESISWLDAAEFCEKLSRQEKLSPMYLRNGAAVSLERGIGYRMPTSAEWEFACRGGTSGEYWSGDQATDLQKVGWHQENSGSRLHAVGELAANPFGLFDVHGNVWEWVQDIWDENYYRQFDGTAATDPTGANSNGTNRIIRGGDWHDPAKACRAGLPFRFQASENDLGTGFRVMLSVDAVKQMVDLAANSSGPPPAVAPFDADQAKAHQEAWAKHLNVPVEHTNSIGMKFRLIPPGEFTMGTENPDPGALQVPAHRVRLTKPFYYGMHEVRQSDYERVMKKNPSTFNAKGKHANLVAGEETGNLPVDNINWNDAMSFCRKLSELESVSAEYRLPTEAEFEFACSAGGTSPFWYGVSPENSKLYGWCDLNAGKRPHPVGQLAANPFGLYDIIGNGWEWMADWHSASYHSQFQNQVAVDPTGPPSGKERMTKGGSWFSAAAFLKTASSSPTAPTYRSNSMSLRVVLPVDAVK